LWGFFSTLSASFGWSFKDQDAYFLDFNLKFHF